MGSFIARRYIQIHGVNLWICNFFRDGRRSGQLRVTQEKRLHIFGKEKGFDQPNEFLESLVFGSSINGIDNLKTKFDWISKDRNVVESYVNDEIVVSFQRPFFADLFDGLGIIHKKNEIEKIPKDIANSSFFGIRRSSWR